MTFSFRYTYDGASADHSRDNLLAQFEHILQRRLLSHAVKKVERQVPGQAFPDQRAVALRDVHRIDPKQIHSAQNKREQGGVEAAPP